MFKSVSDELHDSAIKKQLERESFTQFKERVKDTIVQFPVAKINNLIESTDTNIGETLEFCWNFTVFLLVSLRSVPRLEM